MLFNITIEDSSSLSTPGLTIYSYEFEKIEIDVSHLEEGTVLNFDTTNMYIDDSNEMNDVIMYLENYDNSTPLVVTGDTLVVYYEFIKVTEDVNFNIQDYTNESFKAYLEDDTLYLKYDANYGVKLININSSFLANQFDIVKEKLPYTNYIYINDAMCFIEFE